MIDENQAELLPINFDIHMYRLPCKHLKLGVFDAFGDEKLHSKNKFHYIPTNSKGDFKGDVYHADEVDEFPIADTAPPSKEEMDSDWESSSDKFKHHDFHQVLAFHQYTLVNFYAGWCSHCRKFGPTWKEATERVSDNMSFQDMDSAGAKVHFLKMNCVDFHDVCIANGIDAYPTIRLYKRDGSFEPFRGTRNIEEIINFLTERIKLSHEIKVRHHSAYVEGCQVQGTLEVARVPGQFFLQADGRDVDLNAALTNTSHYINHLSFGPRDKTKRKVLREFHAIQKNVSPLDGKSFITSETHSAPQHFLKVISTQLPDDMIVYQMTHSDRTAQTPKDKDGGYLIPQAKFSYDLSPMSVVLQRRSKRWYEFVTSIFALMGGTFTVMQLFHKFYQSTAHVIENLKKDN